MYDVSCALLFPPLTSPMYFKPLSTHVKESNVFQTLIYLHQGIQCISEPCLLMSGNLMYFRPLFTHVSESNLFQTLIYSHQGIQFISDPHLFTPRNPMLQTLTLTLTLGHNPLTLAPI